jgi:hypothetical protein
MNVENDYTAHAFSGEAQGATAEQQTTSDRTEMKREALWGSPGLYMKRARGTTCSRCPQKRTGAASESLRTNHQGSKTACKLRFKIAARRRQMTRLRAQMNPAQARCTFGGSLHDITHCCGANAFRGCGIFGAVQHRSASQQQRRSLVRPQGLQLSHRAALQDIPLLKSSGCMPASSSHAHLTAARRC